MAEFATAFGIVTGVVGLIPLCGKGYAFIESIVSANRHAEEQLIRIRMQQWVSPLSRVTKLANCSSLYSGS